MFELLKPFLTADFIGKMVRTGIQSLSSGLVANGIMTGDQQNAIAGAVALVASTVWTVIAHYNAVAKANAAAQPNLGGLK